VVVLLSLPTKTGRWPNAYPTTVIDLVRLISAGLTL
jgi:hypothetical protein